jgi:hypothetical protein
MRYLKLAAAILVAAIAAVPASAADPNPDQRVLDVLKEMAMTSDAQNRDILAGRLERYLLLLQPDEVSRSTIDEVSGLLDDDSDYVRWKVSFALSFMGPKANSTIPALKQALIRSREEDAAFAREHDGHTRTGVTSGYTICQTLMTLSTDPLPSDCARYMRFQ